jgi:multidrug efflux pump subunit AcrB
MLLLFESVTIPLAVMTSLPLAVVGTLGRWSTATKFTLFSMFRGALLRCCQTSVC